MNESNELIEICYVSRARVRFAQGDLLALLETARNNNAQQHISGLLLYDDLGTFIQAIEGERSLIEALFAKIKSDSRHENVNLLSKKVVNQRSFSNWHMGFRSLDNNLKSKIPGYTEFTDVSVFANAMRPSFGMEMLDYFRGRSADEPQHT